MPKDFGGFIHRYALTAFAYTDSIDYSENSIIKQIFIIDNKNTDEVTLWH